MFGKTKNKVFRRLLLLCLAIVFGLMVIQLGTRLRDARRVALRLCGQGHFKQLLLALHNYHAANGCLPPAYIADETGRPMHSWRALILPYMEQQALHEQYDFGKPWDDPVNRVLHDRMPRTFGMPSETESHRFTNVVLITGAGTAFEGSKARQFKDISDGLENTILLVETANSDIVWLEPRDIGLDKLNRAEIDANSLGISSVTWSKPCVGFADGDASFALRPGAPVDIIKALVTIDGNEAIGRERALEVDFLK